MAPGRVVKHSPPGRTGGDDGGIDDGGGDGDGDDGGGDGVDDDGDIGGGDELLMVVIWMTSQTRMKKIL